MEIKMSEKVIDLVKLPIDSDLFYDISLSSFQGINLQGVISKELIHLIRINELKYSGNNNSIRIFKGCIGGISIKIATHSGYI